MVRSFFFLGIENFIDYYNSNHYYEAIGKVIPDNVYFGGREAILDRRKAFEKITSENRRRKNML